MRLLPLLLLICFSTVSSCQKEKNAPDDPYWKTEDPAVLGFNVPALEAAFNEAAGLPNFYALLVIRDGKVAAERYYKGKKAGDLFHLRSITKNFTSALTGIALAEGHLDSVDAPIQPYFPDLIQKEKAAITIRHLLNMTSGLEWDENQEIIDVIDHKITHPIDYVLSKPLADTPAVTFNYNSLSPHVVADILTRETGRSLRSYAADQLLTPLGITRFEWLTDPHGAEWGGFGLQLTARDLAKFGQLYLNDGYWEGRQLVPRDWVLQSATQQIMTSGPNSGYSFQWWISRNYDSPLFYGSGYGGQALMLAPEKKLMIVAFQEYFVTNEQHVRQWNDFVIKVFRPIYAAAR